MSAKETVFLHKIGFGSQMLRKDARKKSLFKLVQRISGALDNPEDDRLVVYETGLASIILIGADKVYKCAFDVRHEAKLLQELRNAENVVHLLGELPGDVVCELEYIRGKTIDALMRETGQIGPGKVLKYGSEIMNGLMEMRMVGIWHHRDIRPANVLIEARHDKAVIIDLGIATTEKDALPRQNRRFGGWNDLISLGQLMYFMATGRHVFARSESMSRSLSDVADQIKDYRTEVYADPTGARLQTHLDEVEGALSNPMLRVIVKACLTANSDKYEVIQNMFRDTQMVSYGGAKYGPAS